MQWLRALVRIQSILVNAWLADFVTNNYYFQPLFVGFKCLPIITYNILTYAWSKTVVF